MKKILVLFLLVISASSCVHFQVHNPRKAGRYPEKTERIRLLGDHSPYRDGFDVTFYALDIRIDPATRTIGGKVRMDARALCDLDTIQIDLYSEMSLLSVRRNYSACAFVRKEGAALVKTGGVKKGEKFSLEMSYTGSPRIARRPPWDGGVVWSTDDFGNDWCGVACESEGASLWWPCKDMMDDEADSVDIHLTVPSTYTAVSNGRLAGSEEKGDWSTWKWKVSYPINNYNVTYYVGKFKRLDDSYESDVAGRKLDIDHYVLSWHYSIASKHFQQLKKILAFYEKRFGPYPWYDDGFKLVESPFAGMEHQTAIAYGNGYQNDEWDYNDGGFDYIILHETAHEWWGNAVTAADLGDAWIHEGFATYAEALYVEEQYGKAAYLDYMLDKRLYILNKRPVSRPFGIRYFDYHDEDVYNKGAWLLHSLRYELNDDSLFFDILKTFAMEASPRIVTTKDFIAVVNRKTGRDYQWFFDQYAYNRLAPELEYSLEKGKLYYRWSSRTADGFSMKHKLSGTAGESEFRPEKKRIHVLDIPAVSYPYVSVNRDDYFVKVNRVKRLRKKFLRQPG